MAEIKNEEKTILEADTVFLLMKRGFPISRNVRAQWMLEHLDSVIEIQQSSTNYEDAPELEVVSVLPNGSPESWSPDTSHQFLYKVLGTTSIIFLAHKYRMVFSLDLSPSLATVDIQHGEIVIDEVYLATKRCLEGITKPFTIPGSKRVLQPEIFVTVIAHTPFLTSPSQQVLVQGWLLTANNVNHLIQHLEKQLNLLEEKVSFVAAIANQQLETLKAENERLVGGLFEDGTSYYNKNNSCVGNTAMILPEANFINMLRYGMLALTLLPEHSCAHLIIITDGIVSTTDVHVLDSIMQQLRATTIACSFVHVGSVYHPHCADGLIPYQDLLCFLAAATLGSYMTYMPQIVPEHGEDINMYHKNFLCWQLYRDTTNSIVSTKQTKWHSNNTFFYGHKPVHLLRKKQIDDQVTCTLSSLLCCRLREGYLIKRAIIRDDILEICFVLLWKSNVFLEHLVTCPWSSKSLSVSNTIQYTITIEAPYEFLHDITCLSKKPLKSQYRQGVVSRFWIAIKSLTESDNMLAHFSWFPGSGWSWYNIPDTIRSGIPVFNLSAHPVPNTLQLSDAACPQFGQIWHPVVSMETVQWARWMHTQRITLVLSHDRPLPKYLHQANQNGRFQWIQCRQAAAVLYAMLKTWATFVLVENHTYVQFIYKEMEKPPVAFSLIRVNCKALCIVLNIAFTGGTEGGVRHNVVVDLIERLSQLTLPNRPMEYRETLCCTVVHKPLEKILIRYERVPTDPSTIVFPDIAHTNSNRNPSMLTNNHTTTLSRYLYHNRWLWHVKRPFVHIVPGITLPRLNITAVARILSTITKMRLEEGFYFAYSAAGIINMVLEINMQGLGKNSEHFPCIVQYIIFPPQIVLNTNLEADQSDEDTDEGTVDGDLSTEDCEGSGDFQMITEIWIEPQYGHVGMLTRRAGEFMHSLQYHQLPDAIARIDEECVNALLTLEYLSQICQVTAMENGNEVISGQGFQTLRTSDRSVDSNGHANATGCYKGSAMIDERIHHMHFTFDALSILPKCQQGELLFSMFANGSEHAEEGRQSANRILMEGFLKRVKNLHNKELQLTSTQSQKFTEMLFNRPRDEEYNLAFFSKEGNNKSNEIPSDRHPHWRCFVKGINPTHVIMTILPASEKDVYLIAYPPNQNESDSCNINSLEERQSTGNDVNNEANSYSDNIYEKKKSDSFDQIQSDNFNSNRSDTPPIKNISESEGLLIPVYVYNCSLALLIDALIEKLDSPRNKDIYQDHRFRIGQKDRDEFLHTRFINSMKTSSPEPKSEDSDNATSDQKSLMEHCKMLNFAHCHCYVAAVYKSLALQQPLSYEDMEAAVELCEESLIEIDITNYLQSVCRHLSIVSQDGGDPLDQLRRSNVCYDVKPLHNLIKDKFEGMITVAFRPVPAHPEFYYCSPLWISKKAGRINSERSESDDDLEAFAFRSEINCKLDDSSCQGNEEDGEEDGTTTGANDFRKLPNCVYTDSFNDELRDDNIISDKEEPLFLRLSCSVYFRSGIKSTPVNLLPTCFSEIVQRMDVLQSEENETDMNLNNLKVSLGIICLNLPREVVDVTAKRCGNVKSNNNFYESSGENVNAEYEHNLSGDKKSEGLPDSMKHLPSYQHTAITNLTYEIEWLLQDETATALLDRSPPNEKTLKFVARHVSESTERTSCSMDKVPLHFVFPSDNSVAKFLEELKKLQIDRYCIRQEGTLFYFVKNPDETYEESTDNEKCSSLKDQVLIRKDDTIENIEQNASSVDVRTSGRFDAADPPGCYSDISSIGEGKVGTDDGYEGDSSNSEDDLQWLIELDRRRDCLPNFWLILQVESSHVNVYFHCRFLELVSPEVDCYKQIQTMLVAQLKVICRRVNQYLLLQNLHDTRTCDVLLEPEVNEDNVWRGDTTSSDGSGGSLQSNGSILNFTAGMFRCPVVWEVPFYLHPRLKTGPGRSGLSRGIKALHGVLNWFSVNNRSNMFVYQENNKNVFYLRLHEQTNDGKPLQNKLSESDEKLTVSRSNSAASLSQAKGNDGANDNTLANDTRPRVRSFGEKESDVLNKAGDSIILKVHGISEAGPLVKCDLVQVLQNRLDDAVFEVLSVMLARNPMCKLTPADVHFIQKPYKNPESIVQLSVQPHCLLHVAALGHYLRQNLLQFLYIPKYTDHRTCYHFQDYSQPEGSANRVAESDIFLYNQSPSSGSKGIACIALAIDDSKCETRRVDDEDSCERNLRERLKSGNFEKLVNASICTSKSNAKHLVEFRIWKQGRVNLEALLQKLCAAVRYATWDLVTEYDLLSTALTEPLECIDKVNPTCDDRDASQRNKHIIQSNNPENILINQYEYGEEGKLNEIYHTILTKWFKYALDVGVPAVKKHEVIIHHRHSIPVIVRELQNLIRGHAPDTSSRAFVLRDRQPFLSETINPTPNLLAFCENTFPRKGWITNADERESATSSPVYVSCDFSKHEQGTYTNCILIARNFYQWKVSFGKTIEEELLVPKDQKLLQKFNPLILPSDFIPRQRILLAEIQSGNITFYMYNWSKERSEKFIKQTTSLGTWLSSRSQLFTNIIMQKLGIFHHQPTSNYQQGEQNNTQYYQITDMESLSKFPHGSHGENKSVNKQQHGRSNPLPWNQLVGQATKETESNVYHLNDDIDPVVKTAYDLQDFRHRERKAKEDMNRLYTIWQNRSSASNIPVCFDTLNTFKRHSRLIHFCHTPLLFLPTWRLQSAATRDHSLTPPCSLASSNVAAQQANEQTQSKEDHQSKDVIVKWHRELCNSMLTEYKQYLQILGFSPIQVESQDKTDAEQTTTTTTTTTTTPPHQTHYLKKSMLGGVLLFEIHLAQPFFIAKLRAIECNRLSTKTNSAIVNQFVLSFVDACDKIKINMHLHSFTYDFHLRCIHSYIAGKGFWSLQQGYHLTHFLDDFNKYYSKAPNYARNLVYSDVINVRNLATPARMLYTYLLAHEETYGMRAFVMSNESQDSQEGEYVLFKLQSTPLVSYCDAQDTRYIDDFDVALIVSRIEQPPEIERTEITLKYYLMLTSKRELYPKRDLENNKLGKFRTVYSVIKLGNNTQPVNTSESNSITMLVQSSNVKKICKREGNNPTDSDSRNSDVDSNDNNSKESDEKVAAMNNLAPTPPPVPNSPLTQNHNILNASSSLCSSSSSPQLVQIRQESVNYLGYYSSHEQLMQQLIMSQAQAARRHIIDMIERGASQCRTHLLWNKLFENKSSMTYTEFMELCSLAHVEPLSHLEPRLGSLSSQPVSWYQALTKVLQNRYQECHKQFSTADGNVTHHLILHHRSLQAFTMLTIDLHTSRGDLYVVYRKSAEVTNTPVNMDDVYSLIEGFVNACCFHLWTSLCNQ